MIDDWIILEEVILSGQVPEEDLQQILLEQTDFARWLRSRSEKRLSDFSGWADQRLTEDPKKSLTA